ETEKGTASCVKVDVFKKEMWFTYESRGMNWHKFSVNQTHEFISLSKSGQKLPSLEDLAKDLVETKKESVDVIEENSLERFEKKSRNRNRNKKFNKKPNPNPNSNPRKDTTG